MSKSDLTFYDTTHTGPSSLIMAFSGWMDGGGVSLGAVDFIQRQLEAEKVAEISAQGYYIYNVPGPPEISSLFRPYTRIANGLIEDFSFPNNHFYRTPGQNLLLFSGKEPNLAWEQYCNNFLSVCDRYEITNIYFVGSIGGLTPHTREPRISGSSSHSALRDHLSTIGILPVNYEGPASFVTYLSTCAALRGISMATLIAEIPSYIQGFNPRCVETMVRLLCRLLDLHISVAELRTATQLFDTRLGELVTGQDEMADKIAELEKQYDDEAFDREMGDLKSWFDDQELRV